jgi:hypothetical protein
MLRLGERVRERRARESLERGGVRPRGRPALKQGRVSPEGHLALERGEVSPEGSSSPRARRSFGGTALCPSSEAEFRPRGAGPIILVGRGGCQGRGPLSPGRDCVGCNLQFVNLFVFHYLRKKMGSPGY